MPMRLTIGYRPEQRVAELYPRAALEGLDPYRLHKREL
jgi:hypothetical protein